MFEYFRFQVPRTPHSRRRRAVLSFGEALESRTMLAGNVVATLDGEGLSLRGDDAANSIAIVAEGLDLVVSGRGGTTINGSSDNFVIAAGAMTFDGNLRVDLRNGADTFGITGPLTINGNVTSKDSDGTGEFAITDATISGDVKVDSNNSPDTVSLVGASIGGELSLDLDNGRNFVSLLNTDIIGEMTIRGGNRNDFVLLVGSSVGGLDVRTGSWIDDIILEDITINGDFRSDMGDERDFMLIENLEVTGETKWSLSWDSDLVVIQGTTNFAGDFDANANFGRNDTFELSDNTTFGGRVKINGFDHSALADLTGTNARIDLRVAEALEFQARLNGVDVGDLTLTVDTSANTDIVESNNTLVTNDDEFIIEGTTLAGATVDVTAGDSGGIDLGSTTAGTDGIYSITVDLLTGPTTIMVTATDFLGRMVTEEFDLHVAAGTVIRFDSSLGSFDIELFDDAAPETVANFLGYSDRYIDSIVHRKAILVAEGVNVIQGGGFALDGSDELQAIPTDAPVISEASLDRSNVRGTIAMATLGGNPNSGTSQFFFNTTDNTALDAQQFTVFGEVIGGGMDVVDAIFALDRFDINDLVPAGGGALGTVPLVDYELNQVQLTGTVSIDAGSIQINGTGTMFTTEVDVDDIVFIEEEPYRITEIISDTSMLATSSPDEDVVDAPLFTSPMPTTVPTREEYVVFNSIGAILS